jgi:hypothetical protein
LFDILIKFGLNICDGNLHADQVILDSLDVFFHFGIDGSLSRFVGFNFLSDLLDVLILFGICFVLAAVDFEKLLLKDSDFRL